MSKKNVNNDNLVLIFIIKVGYDHRGRILYEFLFNDTTEEVFGDEWETIPANENAQPPDSKFIKLVGTMKSDHICMDVVQESEIFSLYDAVDKIIALAWEVDKTGDGIDDNRLVFKFGDTKKIVDEILYKRDIVLKYDT